MKSLEGHLLVAARELVDPNFFRAVVLLVRHSEEGALGVILNRPSQTVLRVVWEQTHDTPCLSDEPLHLGGPCQGPLMALHAQPLWGEAEIAPGVYFTASPEQLEQLAAQTTDPCKFFAGYAGWGEGQLEQELAEGSWLILPAQAKHVFRGGARLWEDLLREISGEQFLDLLQVKHRPDDPSLN